MTNFYLTFAFAVTFLFAINAQDFDPTISTECFDGVLSIHARTKEPFNGVMYASGHQKSCAIKGRNKLVTTMRVPLAAISQCGILYNQATEDYFVIVQVRENRKIILQQDRTFNVSCNRQNRWGTVAAQQSRETRVEMGVYAEGRGEYGEGTSVKTHDLAYGRPYNIIVRLVQDYHGRTTYPSTQFIVRTCFAFAGANQTLALTNDAGCSQHSNLLGNFRYTDDGQAIAKLISTFRFPNSDTMHLQCTVELCEEKCLRLDCDRRRDQPFTNAQRQPVAIDEAPINIASTTVRVHEAMNISAITHLEDCSHERRLMAGLCIIFGILFLFAFITNLVFCYLGNFCCYKSGGNSKSSQSSVVGLKGGIHHHGGEYFEQSREYISPGSAGTMRREPQPDPDINYNMPQLSGHQLHMTQSMHSPNGSLNTVDVPIVRRHNNNNNHSYDTSNNLAISCHDGVGGGVSSSSATSNASTTFNDRRPLVRPPPVAPKKVATMIISRGGRGSPPLPPPPTCAMLVTDKLSLM